MIVFGGFIVLFFGIVALVSMDEWVPALAKMGQARRKRKGISDKHTHKWTQWETVKAIEVHVYPEPDAGRDLPDRYDMLLKRSCVLCGLPQTRTVRSTDG